MLLHLRPSIFRFLRLCLISLAAWSLVAFAVSANFAFSQDGDWQSVVDGAVQGSLRDWLPWAVLTPFVFLLVGRWPVDRQRWKWTLPLHLIAGAVCVIVIHAWKETRRNTGRGGPDLEAGPGPGREMRNRREPPPRGDGPRDERFAGPPENRDGRSGRNDRGGPPPHGGARGARGGPGPDRFFDALHFVSFEAPIYLMLVFAAHSLLFFRRSQERAAGLARARLDVLRAQLQPHFLFNTLNTIAGLVHSDPDKADAMLTALSDLLRDTLRTSSETEVPLSREIGMTQRYVAIMQVRFEERLRVTWEISGSARDALVPPLLLQPLVENAVEHGIGPRLEGGTVRISAERRGHELLLTVSDDGRGLHADGEPRHGIGLSNTRERLMQLHGDAAHLSLSDGEGVTVSIVLPFRTAS